MTHQILYRDKGSDAPWKPFSEYNSRLAAKTAVSNLNTFEDRPDALLEFRLSDPHGYHTLARRVALTALIVFTVAAIFLLGYVTGFNVAVYR